MVRRCKVAVTDLDGTLIHGNSLKWILALGLKRLLRKGRLIAAFKVLCLGGLALFKIVSHETMKYGSLRLFGNDPILMAQMHRRAIERLNQEVADRLEQYKKDGCRILLATAASENYVPHVWPGEYVASPFGGPDLKGERKWMALEKWVEENDAEIVAFFTDSKDDLPTVKEAEKRGAKIYLVNPDKKLAASTPQAEIINQLS